MAPDISDLTVYIQCAGTAIEELLGDNYNDSINSFDI